MISKSKFYKQYIIQYSKNMGYFVKIYNQSSYLYIDGQIRKLLWSAVIYNKINFPIIKIDCCRKGFFRFDTFDTNDGYEYSNDIMEFLNGANI